MKHTKPKIKRSPAEKEAIYAKPLSKQFEVVYTHPESGYSVYKHVLADPEAEDYAQVLAVAKAYAAECDCRINPEIDRHATEARKRIFAGLAQNYDRSNPDLYTEKYGYIDVKSPKRKNNIVSNANDACAQGATAVLTNFILKNALTIYKAKSITFDIFGKRNIDRAGNPNYTKDEIHWFIDGTLLKLNRSKKNKSFST